VLIRVHTHNYIYVQAYNYFSDRVYLWILDKKDKYVGKHDKRVNIKYI